MKNIDHPKNLENEVLDRRQAVPALVGRHEDFLIVAGLAGTARDMAAMTDDGAHVYAMAGAMGSGTTRTPRAGGDGRR
jgi:phosphonopyruvate decarboxylase